MTKDVIYDNAFKEIKRYINSKYWVLSTLAGYKFGKDDKGYYIETSGLMYFGMEMKDMNIKSIHEYFEKSRIAYNKTCHRNCPSFYWKSHEGTFSANSYVSNFNSLDGLPDKIDRICFNFHKDEQCRVIDCGEHTIKQLEIDTDMCDNQDVELTGKPKVNLIITSKNTQLKTSFKPKKIKVK